MSNYQHGVAVRPQALIALDPCDERTVQDLENQQRVTSWPYYSTVKFDAPTADAAPGPFSYVMAKGTERRAFAYGLRETKQAAGYSVADGVATAADTNITTKNQTISGQFVEIKGIAFQWHTTAINKSADPAAALEMRTLSAQFVSALMRVISCEIGLNGDENTYKLGTIGMVPGAGGLRGGAPLAAGLPFLDGNQDQQFAANGWETRSNFFRVPEGLIWKTSDKPDGNLNVIFRTQETLTIESGGSIENRPLGTNQAAIPSVSAGYNYPALLAAELKVFLVGQTIGGRSRSA